MEDTLLYIGTELIWLLVRRVLGSAGFRVVEAENLASDASSPSRRGRRSCCWTWTVRIPRPTA